ncbi:MAG: S1 RNA-binding domain-containing protein [Anaerolineales bacterium]|nr:MAG: S1 RNA-binding domain-containing protein [Anaerolineales bacterium]
MMIEDVSHQARGENGPPQVDESWWAAVLEEEEKHLDRTPHRNDNQHPSRINQPGDPEDWVWAHQLYENDDVIDLTIIGHNRGGLLVEARSLRGFVPASHLLEIEPDASEDLRSKYLETLVGCILKLKVIEFDPDRGRLVFSQRAAEAGPGKRVELLTNLKPGDRVFGKVTNITRFGVFVDLGGVEGLIHVSELSWGRVKHPSDVVKCGQELEVQILTINRDQDRVALSLKELLPDPWRDLESRYVIGQFVDGVITNVVKFGAFVGIDEGLEGLIHVSELGDGNFMHPRNVVQEGDPVRVRIIHIDAGERRLGLSLRGVPLSERSEGTETESESSDASPLY